jgi:hypothetical protein
MNESAPNPDPEIEHAVRRRVGIAALRKIRKLVDEDARQQADEAALGRSLAWIFGVLFVLALLWLVLR